MNGSKSAHKKDETSVEESTTTDIETVPKTVANEALHKNEKNVDNEEKVASQEKENKKDEEIPLIISGESLAYAFKSQNYFRVL